MGSSARLMRTVSVRFNVIFYCCWVYVFVRTGVKGENRGCNDRVEIATTK